MTETELKDQVNRWLFKMLGSEDLVEGWWNTRNRYWDNRTPLDVWHNTSHQEVVNYVKKFLQR